MSTDEFITGSQILLRILIFGGLGIISLMIIYTILKTLKAAYRINQTRLIYWSSWFPRFTSGSK